MKKLILIGAGGFAKSVLDSIDVEMYEIYGFIDDIKSGIHLGYPILSNQIDFIEGKEKYSYFVSIGDNRKRKYWYQELTKRNLEIISVIDKTAILSKNITYGRGLFVGKLAVINSDVRIGENVIVNTKALLEHGVRVGHHTNISTNVSINGDVIIGEETFIGSSSVVNGQLCIGNHTVIGSGSVVIRNVDSDTVVAGVPAKEVHKDR